MSVLQKQYMSEEEEVDDPDFGMCFRRIIPSWRSEKVGCMGWTY